VPAAGENAADLFLIGPEGFKSEAAVKHLLQRAAPLLFVQRVGRTSRSAAGILAGFFPRGEYTPGLAHHIPHILLDTSQKRPQLSLPTLDALEISLPLPGHRGTLDLGMHHIDQANPLVGGLNALAAPDN